MKAKEKSKDRANENKPKTVDLRTPVVIQVQVRPKHWTERIIKK